MSLNDLSMENDSQVDNAILEAMGTSLTGEQNAIDPLEQPTEHINSVVAIVHNVQDKQELLSEISQSETINKYQAEVVQECFGGFIGEKVSIEEFTHFPTRSNHTFTVNFMKANIKAGLESLVDNWKSYSSTIVVALEKYTEVLEDVLIPAVKELSETAPAKYVELYKSVTEGKDNIYSAGNEMLRLDNVSILSPHLLSIDVVGSSDKVAKAQEIIKVCFYEAGVYSLFKAVLGQQEQSELEDKLLNSPISLVEAEVMTVSEFILVLSSIQTSERINNIAQLALDNVAQLRECVEYIDRSPDFFNEKLNLLYTTHLKLAKYQSFFAALERIYSNADELLGSFKK